MKSRPLALLAFAVGVPAIIFVLLVRPQINPPQASPPPLTQAATSADAPRWTAIPTATLSTTSSPLPAATPEPIARTISVVAQKTRGPFGNRIRPVGVWTGKEVIVWGGWIGRPFGVGPPQPDGAAYNPRTDRWRRIAEAPIPASGGAKGVWTGTEALIWGGSTSIRPAPRPTGAAYDPARDTWRRIADPPIRLGLQSVTVWSGDEWIFGALRAEADVPSDVVHYVVVFAAYEPDTNTWRRLPDLGPLGSDANELLSTGEELLLFNGSDGLFRLLPSATAWAPSAAALVGQELDDVTSMGDRVFGVHPRHGVMEWDATADSWDSVAVLPIPASGINAVGRELLVLNDDDGLGAPDLAFHLETGELWALSRPQLDHRQDHVSHWVGDRLFIWGGWIGGPSGRPAYQYGWLYTPDW